MPLSDDTAAAYCMICNRPIPLGPTCDSCNLAGFDNDDPDNMGPEERARYCALQVENGNLLDAIDAMMFDGDVRVESVVTALHLVSILVHHQVRPVHHVTDQLVRLIDQWETDL